MYIKRLSTGGYFYMFETIVDNVITKRTPSGLTYYLTKCKGNLFNSSSEIKYKQWPKIFNWDELYLMEEINVFIQELHDRVFKIRQWRDLKKEIDNKELISLTIRENI